MDSSKRIARNIDQLDPELPGSTWMAVAAGVVGFAVTLFIYFGLQRIFQHLPFFEIINAVKGSANTLCFAGITSSATILPLLLTIMSLTRSESERFDSWFYDRVKTIGLLCCGAFVSGLVSLMVLSAPIGDMPEVSNVWYEVFYYVIVGGLSTMVGLLASILLMLYYAILHIVRLFNPHNALNQPSE